MAIGRGDAGEQRETENDEQSRDLCVPSRPSHVDNRKGCCSLSGRRCTSRMILFVTHGAIP